MVVGAIGPWEIGDQDSQRWLRNMMRRWLARWDVSLGYTDLEPGVGILFAEVLSEAVIPFRVILPCEKANVPAIFQSQFDALRKRAVALHCLEGAFNGDWQPARKQLVEQCDVVLSVLTGDQASDREFVAIQIAVCQARGAVVSLNLYTRTATVVCKNDSL